MTKRDGTRVIGITEWVAKSSRVAGVKPLCEKLSDGWFEANTDDFTPRGQVFWPRSFSEHKGLVIGFTLTEGNGQDDFCVSEPTHAHLVLDYRSQHYAAALDKVSKTGIPAPDASDPDPVVYVLCAQEILLGPLRVQRVNELHAALAKNQNFDRVPYRRDDPDTVVVPDGRMFCLSESQPTGYLDCRSDSDVLKTALRDAARIVPADAPDHLSTKRLIDATVDAFVVNGLDDELAYERLRRAAHIFDGHAPVHVDARTIVDEVLALPQSKESLRVARELAETQAAAAARDRIETELADKREEIERLQSRRTELEQENSQFQQQLDSMEGAVVDRVEGAVQDATDLLSESVLLRAIGVGSVAPPQRARHAVVDHAFPRRSGPVKTVATGAFRNASAASAHPELTFRRIHSALLAGLVPVLTGSGGMSALAAYAHVACAGRMAMLPVTHDLLHPVDLLGVRATDPETPRMHTNLLQVASSEAKEHPGLLVLESFNRAPTESYLVPWISAKNRTINAPASVRQFVGVDSVDCRGLFIAATDIAGSTTAPISPDLWGLAVAIDVPEPADFDAGAAALSAMEFATLPSDFDSELIDLFIKEARQALEGFWPIDEGVLSAAWNFAAHSSTIGSPGEVRRSVIECSLVPTLASSLTVPGLASAIDAIVDWAGPRSGVDRPTLNRLARRLQRRFQ